MNLHRELAKIGYELNLGGITVLRPGMRYVIVQYPEAMRAELKNAKGAAGVGTALAIPDELEAQAISQFYPASNEGWWYFAMLKVKGQLLSALSKAQFGQEIRAFMVQVRSMYFKDQLDGAHWYQKQATGVFSANPYCVGSRSLAPAEPSNIGDNSYWALLNPSFSTPAGEFPTALEFIQDGLGLACYRATPQKPPETQEAFRARAARNGADADPGAKLREPTPTDSNAVRVIKAAIGYEAGKVDGFRASRKWPEAEASERRLQRLYVDLQRQLEVEQIAYVEPAPKFLFRGWRQDQGVVNTTLVAQQGGSGFPTNLDSWGDPPPAPTGKAAAPKTPATPPAPLSKHGRVIRFEEDEDKDREKDADADGSS